MFKTKKLKQGALLIALLLLFAFLVVIFRPAFISSEKLINNFNELIEKKEKQGLKGILLIKQDNAIIFQKAYGLENKTPKEIGFSMGSITKLITATAIIELLHKNRLELSDPISKYFNQVPADKQKITIKQLLMHTSGLVDYVAGDYDLIEKQEFIVRLFNKPLIFEPGSDNNYSNSAYSLLGMIIEEVSKQSYEEFIYQNVLKPASMLHTGYLKNRIKESYYLNGYFENGRLWGTSIDKPWLDDGPSWTLRANGGLLTTIEDLDSMLSFYSSYNYLDELINVGYFDKNFFNGNIIMGDAGGNGIFNVDIEWNLSKKSGAIMITSNERFKAESLLLDESQGKDLLTKLIYL